MEKHERHTLLIWGCMMLGALALAAVLNATMDGELGGWVFAALMPITAWVAVRRTRG